jgi:hypothetical protein
MFAIALNLVAAADRQFRLTPFVRSATISGARPPGANRFTLVLNGRFGGAHELP